MTKPSVLIMAIVTALIPEAVFGQAKSPLNPADTDLNIDQLLPHELSDLSDFTRWWTALVDFLMSKGVNLVTNLLAATVIFLVGRWLAGCLTRLVQRLAMQARVDETLVKFISNLVYAALLSFVALSSLNRLGVDTASFTAVVAAAGLAIGFALQGSLANLAAGVMLIMFKPFKVGDNVSAGGSAGIVQEIQIFNTLLKTSDNALVIVPNSTVTNGTITNYSTERVRRVDLTARCSYDCDLRQVKRFLTQLLLDDERILRLPPPHVAVDQLADNYVSFLVQPWVRSEDYARVRADLLESIKVGFDTYGYRPQAVKPPAPRLAA